MMSFQVRKQALKVVKERSGDFNNELDVKGEYEIQFGLCRGQTFRWLLENALGYVGWLLNSIQGETTTTAPISQNKAAFWEYAMSFEACHEVVAMKKAEMDAKQKTQTRTTPPVSKASPLARRLASGQITNTEYVAKVSKESRFRFAPTIPPCTRVRASTSSPSKSVDIGDAELCDIVAEIEKKLGRYHKTKRLATRNIMARSYCPNEEGQIAKNEWLKLKADERKAKKQNLI